MLSMMFLLLHLKLILHNVLSTAENCDRARTDHVPEGNIGQSGYLQYIGVLIVHSREFQHDSKAMTGIVLIKDKYAIANANDVVKIPPAFFKTNTRAMFLPARNTRRFLKPTSYITHPNYPYVTPNSFAIIELNVKEVANFPLTPICLPTERQQYTSHSSKYLYLTAITDENTKSKIKLEKFVYKIHYLDKDTCREYHTQNLVKGKSQELMPPGYSCGHVPNTETQCFWENGMALVSNATGIFYLIGLTVHGPGCEAPARFMDLAPYLSWIHSVTTTKRNNYDDDNDEEGSRGGRREGGRKRLVPNVPISTLFAHEDYFGAQDARRLGVSKHEYERYPFNAESLAFHIVKPSEDKNSILITSLRGDDMMERYDGACEVPGRTMYKEDFEVRAQHLRGTANYKLSLYDVHLPTLACVRLTILCTHSSTAILSFREELFNYKEHIELRDYSGETPKELFKHFTVLKGSAKNKGNFNKHDEFSQPEFINDGNLFYSENVIKNYDLFIKFEFDERAIMQFEMFAESEDNPEPTTTTNSTTTTTTKTIRRIWRRRTYTTTKTT